MIDTKILKNIPHKPGVYLMRGLSREIIYIGKAKSLKKRVSSYFQKNKNHPYKTAIMVDEITDIDFIAVKSETEALLLECRYIKEFQPKYNMMLKDDKQYPYLKITYQMPIPRLEITRMKKDDGGMYFGPFTDVTLLRQTVDLFEPIFKIRACTPAHPTEKDYKHCLYAKIGQCTAPCVGHISMPDYLQTFHDLSLLLNGRSHELFYILERRMKEYAQNLEYEKATKLRDTIKSLEALLGHQSKNMDQHRRLSKSHESEIQELQKVLQLSEAPLVIEAFDISNFQGREAVGSMVCFQEGNPDKRYYRRFQIKTIHVINDYEMMKEVVYRRYKRLLDENGSLPNLILIDGGLGHLHSALEMLNILKLDHIPTIGLAKKYEEIFTKHGSEPIVLPRNSPALHLIQRIRDEAHRFAITYHRQLRQKKIHTSMIHDIPGIGAEKAKLLLKHFGSLYQIKKATVEEIVQLPGFGQVQAHKIYSFLHSNKKIYNDP